jgi:predicted RNase H-like HicB family nuclease
VERNLAKAEYQFDESVNEWAGWIKELPGIYAQGKAIESARNQLAEMLEEYLIINIQERKQLKDFGIPVKAYTKAYK